MTVTQGPPGQRAQPLRIHHGMQQPENERASENFAIAPRVPVHLSILQRSE